jgi:CBS domain-containing protein
MKKTVKELMIKRFVKVREEEEIYKVIEKIAEDRETMLACVVDKEDRLKGVITPKELLKIVEARVFEMISHPFIEGREALGLLTLKYAKDIMSAPISIKPDDRVEQAINIMLDEGFYEVPVVNEKGQILGEINYFGIIIDSVGYLRGDEKGEAKSER